MELNAPARLKRLRKLSDILLIASLGGDGNDVVRHEAAFVLGDRKREKRLKLNDEAFVALCISALLDKSILVRHEAALALANFKTKESRRVLNWVKLDESKEVSGSAEYAIEDMG